MTISAPIYHQLFNLLRHHTTYKDLRHLKALAWMIHALISLEHSSSTVAFWEYKLILRLAQKLLSKYDDVMILADRGFANHHLLHWLQTTNWHYCLRLPSDVHIGNGKSKGRQLKTLFPTVGEATLYHNVFLWLESKCKCNLVLANVKGINDPWAIITSEKPSLETLWQ